MLSMLIFLAVFLGIKILPSVWNFASEQSGGVCFLFFLFPLHSTLLGQSGFVATKAWL